MLCDIGDSETQVKEKENKHLSTNKRGSSKKGSKRKSDDDSLPDQTSKQSNFSHTKLIRISFTIIDTKRKPKGSIVAISERKQDSLQLTPQKKINAKETQNTHS